MTTVSLWQDNARWPALPHRREEADVCIVGAGIVGSALATFLSQAGKSVVVLEARDVALGASGRNAGFIATLLKPTYHREIEQYGHAAAKALRDLSFRNRALIKGFLDAYGVWYEEPGSMILAWDEAEAREFALAARALLADGYAIEYTDRDPTGRGFHAAISQPGDIATQPYWLTTQVMAHSGTVVIPNCAVRQITQERGIVTVYGQRATVRAAQVCLCTNAYSPFLHPYFADKIVPARGQMLATAPVPRFMTQLMGCEWGYQYFRQLPDGRFLLGGWRKQYVAEERTYNDAATTPHIQHGLEGFLQQHFPELAGVPIEHRWSGIMGFTPDGRPLVGRLPDLPQVYFAVGFSGEGMGIGAAVAERAATFMLDGTSPGIFATDRPTLAES
ncbi:MAG TPA: FAD-binding oxidoreductase [Thermomicrobiales bacterium]|nr:FAD-binding oxidoreductase [Thermomicrobiales bacterium]